MPVKKNRSLVLASASPRRKELMRDAGYQFRIVPSRVSERIPRNLTPRQIVIFLALKKARDVAKWHPNATVLGADTLVVIKNKVIGKPRNPSHAKQILRLLSGSVQRVYTGVAVVWDGGKREKKGAAVSYVTLRSLSPVDIERASRNHLDKAGAYAIQEKKDPFVARIRGDIDNVVGLPMRVVRRLLKGAG